MSESVGLALWRRNASGDVEVLIGHMGGPFWAKKHEGAWSFPKGLVEVDDRDPLAVAEREFAEELGRSAPPGESVSLSSSRSAGKRIEIHAREGDFDADSIESNTFELEWPPRSGRVQRFPEIDRAAWVSLDDARRLLAKSQRVFVDRLFDLTS